MPINTDAYYHKTVAFRFKEHNLQFRTSRQLFSSHDIDTGTRFLLHTVVEAKYSSFQRILDVGCGYGPLGLTLKKIYPQSLVHLFDRDALAVEYSRQNAALNRLNDVEIYGSLGYDDVQRNDFDLIVANIPDHAGEKVITYLLRDARYYLVPGGIVAIVVVRPLEKMVEKILSQTPGVKVIFKRNHSGHTVFHYQFSGVKTPLKPEQSALERGIYHRQDITIRLEKLEYKMQTADGLPEFDSLSYGSELIMKALAEWGGGEIKNAAVFNPRQGHIAVVLWRLLKPETIMLIDRDLLALRYSQLNLKLNNCPPDRVSVLHQAGLELKPGVKYDLIFGSLREDDNKEAAFSIVDKAYALLTARGVILISADSTAITRLADYVERHRQLRIKTKERRRGYGMLMLGKLDRLNKMR